MVLRVSQAFTQSPTMPLGSEFAFLICHSVACTERSRFDSVRADYRALLWFFEAPLSTTRLGRLERKQLA
jgi:hypothetical protein